MAWWWSPGSMLIIAGAALVRVDQGRPPAQLGAQAAA
jgi:hypothetical protein